MVFNARWAGRQLDRRPNAAIPAAVAGMALIASATTSTNLGLSIGLITIIAAGIISIMPVFWMLAGRMFAGMAAAAGLAIINSVGSLAGVTGAFTRSRNRSQGISTGHLRPRRQPDCVLRVDRLAARGTFRHALTQSVTPLLDVLDNT